MFISLVSYIVIIPNLLDGPKDLKIYLLLQFWYRSREESDCFFFVHLKSYPYFSNTW